MSSNHLEGFPRYPPSGMRSASQGGQGTVKLEEEEEEEEGSSSLGVVVPEVGGEEAGDGGGDEERVEGGRSGGTGTAGEPWDGADWEGGSSVRALFFFFFFFSEGPVGLKRGTLPLPLAPSIFSLRVPILLVRRLYSLLSSLESSRTALARVSLARWSR